MNNLLLIFLITPSRRYSPVGKMAQAVKALKIEASRREFNPQNY